MIQRIEYCNTCKEKTTQNKEGNGFVCESCKKFIPDSSGGSLKNFIKEEDLNKLMKFIEKR